MTGDLARRLSVIIPTRDRWEILAQTQAALANQTVSGFTTIVAVDGRDQTIPPALAKIPGLGFVTADRGGPGAARNAAVSAASGELLLFLGDDTIPQPDLVERHLARHEAEPETEVAVLGKVRWHPRVARRRVNRWLEWSGSQFDYRQLDREPGLEAGFGRFYASNVSVKRDLFDAVGGFDEAFTRAAYEDLDFGWRASRQGMRLRYEPAALALHLHAYDLAGLKRRFAAVAVGERLMCDKHPWFEPWFRERITRHAAAPQVSGAWAAVVDLVPERIERLRCPVQARADRWYHQQLAGSFMEGWADH